MLDPTIWIARTVDSGCFIPAVSSLREVLELANATTRECRGDADCEAPDCACARRRNSGRVNDVFYLIRTSKIGKKI